MKFFTLTTLFSILSFLSIGQTIKIEEPEFSGIIVYVNDTVGSGIRLEQQASSVKTKSNAAAYIPIVGLAAGKAKSKSVIAGPSSPVKIPKNKEIKFIVKVKDNSIDPVSVINIFRLTPEGQNRTLELASASTLGGSKSGDIKFFPFIGKKYGSSSYLITVSNLETGEYAITLADRRDLFNMFNLK